MCTCLEVWTSTLHNLLRHSSLNLLQSPGQSFKGRTDSSGTFFFFYVFKLKDRNFSSKWEKPALYPCYWSLPTCSTWPLIGQILFGFRMNCRNDTNSSFLQLPPNIYWQSFWSPYLFLLPIYPKQIKDVFPHFSCVSLPVTNNYSKLPVKCTCTSKN